jgi:hypothetical protein
MNPYEYSVEERELLLTAMRAAAGQFYADAVRIGYHQFVEFTGLLNEHIRICERAHQEGKDFSTCGALPVENHHLKYIGEKLNCIYGDSLTEEQGEVLRKAIMGRL